MLKPPPDVTPEIVKGDLTEEQLQGYLEGEAVAVDTETLGLVHIRDRLCLVQLCDRAGRATLVQITRETLVTRGGEIVPVRLRERIRAAGPTNRTDLGKQARPGRLAEAA